MHADNPVTRDRREIRRQSDAIISMWPIFAPATRSLRGIPSRLILIRLAVHFYIYDDLVVCWYWAGAKKNRTIINMRALENFTKMLYHLRISHVNLSFVISISNANSWIYVSRKCWKNWCLFQYRKYICIYNRKLWFTVMFKFIDKNKHS